MTPASPLQSFQRQGIPFFDRDRRSRLKHWISGKRITEILVFLLPLLFSFPSFAEIREMTAEGFYVMAPEESPPVAMLRAKRNAARKVLDTVAADVLAIRKVGLNMEELKALALSLTDFSVMEQKIIPLDQERVHWVRVKSRVTLDSAVRNGYRVKAEFIGEDYHGLELQEERVAKEIVQCKNRAYNPKGTRIQKKWVAKIKENEKFFQSLEFFRQGMGWRINGRPEKALEAISASLAANPHHALAYYYRAILLKEMALYDRAVEESGRAITQDPLLAKAYYLRAVLYGRKGHPPQESFDYDKAAAIRPDFEKQYYLSLSQSPMDFSRDEEIARFSKSIAENPRDAWRYYSRGLAYRTKGGFAKALADFDQAIALDPEHVSSYYHRAILFRMKGDFERARADYERVIRIDPSLAWPYYNRGLLFARQGQYDQALRDYSEAMAKDPYYVWAYFDRGLAYRMKGDDGSAIADFTLAIQGEPQFPLSYLYRAHCYFRKGEFARGIQDERKAARMGDEKTQRELAAMGISW
jgi:tetratricopeptide (TPR) repeat protein